MSQKENLRVPGVFEYKKRFLFCFVLFFSLRQDFKNCKVLVSILTFILFGLRNCLPAAEGAVFRVVNTSFFPRFCI